MERRPQSRAVCRALAALLCFAFAQMTGGLAPCDIPPGPPACNRRKIVRRRGRHGAAPPTRGLREPATGLTFEPQHLHAENACARQIVAKTFRHGTEVLADDHGAVSV